jgi:DNA-binding NtrC family response regulator
MMTYGDNIDLQDLPPYLYTPPMLYTHPQHHAPRLLPDCGTLAGQERLLLVRALAKVGGNRSKAARALRIGRDALRYKLKKHSLDKPNSGRVSAAAP